MSMQTRHRLTIVEVVQPPARRSSAEISATAGNSSSKRTRLTREDKSVKKRTAGKKTLSSPKAKVKPASRPAKSSTAAQSKSLRRQPIRRQPKMAIQPVLPIEMDTSFLDAEQPQSDHSVKELPAALELSFADRTVMEEELSVEDKVHPELELSPLQDTSMELEVIAEPQLNSPPETIIPIETPMPGVLLAEPQDIRRTLAFQWNLFLQVLAKGWSWLQRHLKTQQAKKRLRVCESVSLGEKRFIAVVQVDGEQFLVGGSSSSVSTLAHLEQPREFSDVFRRYGQSGMQA